MLKNQTSILFIITGLLSFLFLDSIKTQEQIDIKKDNVMCITMPKSGTEVLLECITLMSAEDTRYKYLKQPKIPYVINVQKPIKQSLLENMTKSGTKLFSLPVLYTKQAHDILKQYTYANFFLLRDPRAVLVSQALEFSKRKIGGKKRKLEDIIIDLINGTRKQNINPKNLVLSQTDLLLHIGLHDFYQLFIPWIRAENFYTVRFENLIGTTKNEELKNIAAHLGIIMSDEKISAIINNIACQKDSWMQHFTPKVAKSFKSHKNLMKMLVDLGYEKDSNW